MEGFRRSVLLLAIAASMVAKADFGFAEPSNLDPQLSIVHDLNELRIAWPLEASDWILEYTPAWQVFGVWTRVSPSLYQSNRTHLFVPVPGLNESRFYRLRLPTIVPGLSGFWRFDEAGGTVAIDEINTGPAVFLTNTAWAVGRVGASALQFNAGTGGSASIDNQQFQVFPRSGEPFSFSLWFSPTELLQTKQALVGRESNAWHVTLQTKGPATNELVFSGGALTVTGRAILLPKQWYHLTVTYNGIEGSIYLDHNLLARGSGTLPTGEGRVLIGGGVVNAATFMGRIDELRTYTNCLSADQVALSGRWDFNEEGGITAFDGSVQGHHGRLASAAMRVSGKEALGIASSSGVVEVANDYQTLLPPSGKPFSISAWIRPDALPNEAVGLMGAGGDSGWRVLWEAESGQQYLRFCATPTGSTLDLRVPVFPQAGIWSKLDLTYNGAIANLYLNGRKLGSANGALRASRGPLVIGGASPAQNFVGTIDDVRVYLRDRDDAEVGPIASVMWETVFLNSSTNIALHGKGPPGRSLTCTITDSIMPTNGTITHVPGSGIVTYHSIGRKGPDAFTYVVSDGEFTSAPATVTISAVQPHWITPTGGSIQPFDGSSPSRAWRADSWMALDAIWKTNQFYDCFFYAPGTYETSGWKFLERSTANPGCKHIGSGSSGPDASILKLVNATLSWSEETIFGARHNGEICDNFEVHDMILDCNAAGNPKYTRGEPITFKIPLTSTGLVETVILKWGSGNVPGRLGRATEFSLSCRGHTNGTYVTNLVTLNSTGDTDVLTVNSVTDELLLGLNQRASNVDFYSLAEVLVTGAGVEVSLPTAKDDQGVVSELDPESGDYHVVRAVDGDNTTAWASGAENQVEIIVPLNPGTLVDGLVLHWNCRRLSADRQLGGAADYLIRARDTTTGVWLDVPFVRGPRSAKGFEANSFAATVSTDRLMVVLLEREEGVNHYSLREISAINGSQAVPLRVPTALNNLGGHATLSAFDGIDWTQWASGTQGAVSAINLIGNNLRFSNLHIKGFGTKVGRECFPMFMFFIPNDSVQTMGNVLVENCTFSDPATNNTDGVSVLVLVGSEGRLTNAVVRGCTVRGVRSHFTYSGAFVANQVEGCLVEDCGRGIYFEPDQFDNIGSVLIHSNRFVDVEAGVYLLSFPGRQFDSLTCIGNEVVFKNSTAYAFSACDVCIPGPSASITNVTMLGNIVRHSDWLPLPGSTAGGILYSDFRNAVVANNIIASGGPNSLRVRHCPAGVIPPPPDPELCDEAPPTGIPGVAYPSCVDSLLPGYRRAWLNNRDLSGGLLDVKCIRWGIDGLAAEQQWLD